MKKLLLIALLIVGCSPTQNKDCAGVIGGDNWESNCGCVSADNNGNGCEDLVGLWIYSQGYEELRLTFTQDGIFKFERLLNGVTTVSTSGTYIIENSQINISDSSCDPFIGQYNYSVINDIISFSQLQDDCYGRASSMTNNFAKSI